MKFAQNLSPETLSISAVTGLTLLLLGFCAIPSCEKKSVSESKDTLNHKPERTTVSNSVKIDTPQPTEPEAFARPLDGEPAEAPESMKRPEPSSIEGVSNEEANHQSKHSTTPTPR